jgi:hypothetical protein
MTIPERNNITAWVDTIGRTDYVNIPSERMMAIFEEHVMEATPVGEWDWHEVQADWIDRQPPSVIDVHDSPSGFPWGDQGVEPLAFYGRTTSRDAFPFHGLPIPAYLHLVTLELMTPILPRS